MDKHEGAGEGYTLELKRSFSHFYNALRDLSKRYDQNEFNTTVETLVSYVDDVAITINDLKQGYYEQGLQDVKKRDGSEFDDYLSVYYSLESNGEIRTLHYAGNKPRFVLSADDPSLDEPLQEIACRLEEQTEH